MFADIAMHPTLPATDIERAKDWYAEKLELKPVDEAWGGYWYETAEGARFYIYPTDKAGTNEATAMAFSAGDEFDEAVSFLRDRDVDFIDFEMQGMSTDDGIMTAPNGMKAAWFEDSEGNILALNTE